MSISNSPFMSPYLGSAYSPAISDGAGTIPSYLSPTSPLGQFNQQNTASLSTLSGLGGMTGMSGMPGMGGLGGMTGMSGLGGMMDPSGGGQNILQMMMSIMQMMMSLILALLGGTTGGSMASNNPLGSGDSGLGSAGSAGGNSGDLGAADSGGGSGGSGGYNKVKSLSTPGPVVTPASSSQGDPNYYPASTPSSGDQQGGTGNLFAAGKEGLGVNGTSANGDGSNLASTKASWYYNWSPNASSNVNDPNATFIPMIWGKGNMNSKDLQAAANSNSPMLLTFNEPELPGQANMSVQDVLSYWPQLEGTGKKLSSPAVSNGPEGMKWLDDFMAAASAGGHRVDSISLHWYGSSAQSADQNVASLKAHIEQVHKKYPNLPINLTEFGVDATANGAGKDQAFLSGAEKMLNDLPYVQMYSPYGTGDINGN